MKKENLIAYALNFASFLLDSKISTDINRIILFGSVARGDFNKESDIDIFIDTEKNIEEESKKILSLFKQSEIQKKWELKGLKNEISIKIGKLKEWKLRRNVISDGMLIYGKLKEMPEDIEYYLMFSLSFINFKKSQKVKLWRKLYGYKQRIGEKIYTSGGLIEGFNGKRVEGGIVIPIKNKKAITEFLNNERIKYKVYDIWSDSF